jgi:putative transposase
VHLSQGTHNAMAESFFATLECELLAKHPFKTHAEARIAIFEYLEGFYNPHRLHSSIGYLSPVNFERRSAPRKPSKLTRPCVH